MLKLGRPHNFRIRLSLKQRSQLLSNENVRKKRIFTIESNMQLVLTNISRILSCTEDIAAKLYEKFPSIRSVDSGKQISSNIALLMKNGVSRDSIIINAFLLIMEIDTLKRKLNAIKLMGPRHIDDFIPLLEMNEQRLTEVAVMSVNERHKVPHNSRIYYLSNELQIQPEIVSKYCSKFDYIFSTPFCSIEKKLNIMLDYNVDTKKILKSLYVFKCSDQVFISRLEELFSNGLFDIKFWFFKCTDEKFEKIVQAELNSGPSAMKAPMELVQKFEQRNLEKSTILSRLNSMLCCDNKKSVKIYYNFISHVDQLERAKNNIDFLNSNKVSLESIIKNSMVLTLPIDIIMMKMKIIQQMKPESIEDFFPLIAAETSLLDKFREKVKEYETTMPEKNPIYYFSKKLNLDPRIVSTYFAKNSDLFFGDFPTLREKLDALVAYNVEPISILSSPLTFKLNHETIANCLESFKCQGIDNISSWMLVCDSTRLKKIISRLTEEKKSLGDSTNTVEYICRRLKWDDATKQKALRFYPPLARCNVLKVKAHLDYLLNDTHFTIEDINLHVAVFRTKLAELKLRINELNGIGVVPRKLYVICLDKKRYLELIERICRRNNSEKSLKMFKSIEKRIKER